MWLVAVTDHVNTYLYGPFEYHNHADEFVKTMRNEFSGRIVHIIPHNRIISPFPD